MKIILNASELYLSGLVGYRRNLEAIMRKRKPRFPEKVPGELFGFHIHAAMAECAVAKFLNKYWGFHVNHFESEDVDSYEVRYSQRKDMKVRERDGCIVIAVMGFPPEFEIVGYMHSDEVKVRYEATQPRPDGPPAYFVPHADLRSPEALLEDHSIKPSIITQDNGQWLRDFG